MGIFGRGCPQWTARLWAIALLVVALPQAVARPVVPRHERAPAEHRALALAQQLIAFRTVQGDGNQTVQALGAVREVLSGGGWAAPEIEVTRLADTGYLITRWPGSDPALKPLVVSGHIDVVEAKRGDWSHDPFAPVIKDGYLIGRGATDMKLDVAMVVTSLVELRRSGLVPRRSIILVLSGDEETSMATTRILARKMRGAEMVINTDGGGGVLDEATGKPLYWSWQGAEKAYADFTIEATGPGGHTMAPRDENPIADVALAVARIERYRFKPEINPLTREHLENAARFETDSGLADAMRRFAADQNDLQAIAVLRKNPATIGRIGTTCTATMFAGGHAPNALPQRATATINCRIFPGHSRAEIMDELRRVADVPGLKFADATGGDSVASPASPLRADVQAAVIHAMGIAYPGVPVFASQASGASDSMWFRAEGIDTYLASPLFIKNSEDFSHGLDERTPVNNIKPGLVYYQSLIGELAR